MYEVIGRVSRVLGPVVHAKGVAYAQMLELVEVGEERLIGEIVRLQGDEIAIQVYEDTTGLTPGAAVYGSGMPLSVELGPGLMGSIYDGIQRPLEGIKKVSKQYIQRGIKINCFIGHYSIGNILPYIEMVRIRCSWINAKTR